MDCSEPNIELYFRKYYGALCYFASQYVDDSDKVIEDMVQDCFVRLLEKRPNFESETHLRNHLYISVKNNCLNHIHKNRLRERSSEQIQQTELDNNYSDELFSTEVVRSLIEQIDKLPSQCGQIIKMSYVDGIDNETIAGTLSLSVNTVRAQKMRGKKLLKASMGKVAL